MLNGELDVQGLRREFASARPFPHVVIDELLNSAAALAAAESLPSFETAAARGRSFRALNERGKVQVTDPALFPAPMAAVNAFLASDEFLGFLAELTGIDGLLADPELIGGGVHLTGPRGRLDVHVDFNRHEGRAWFRRLNLLLYLNPSWRTEWGGQLELWDRAVKTRHRSVEPALNQCVIFETSERSFHGVRPVTCPPSEVRRSFAAYYYTRAAPPDWIGRDHSTIFRARPDEVLRGRVLMPLERSMRGVRAAARRVRQRIRGIVERSSGA